jgi:light-regulated signal transduction histidine kinase (bacteriophytochrome)
LQPFIAACANIIVGARNEALRQKLTHDLRISERALKIYAAKLQRSNQELEQFATIASHDMQAPLRKIILFSEYLRDSLGDSIPKESRDYLDRMHKATQKMRNLITDLLMLSRVNRKGQPFQWVDLGEILQDVLSDLEEPLRESKGKIEIDQTLSLEADPIQMHQVLQNLIGNALKFRKADTPPHVCVSMERSDANHASITVQDNGIGFDKKYLDRIFAVFERLHGEQEYEGTGMGLAIVSKIVERHGGTVSAHSSPGQGARFTIVLPIHHRH